MPKITVNYTAGDKVRQAVKPFEGTVLDTRLTDGKPEYLVAYRDPETGDEDERWFTDEQIEAA